MQDFSSGFESRSGHKPKPLRPPRCYRHLYQRTEQPELTLAVLAFMARWPEEPGMVENSWDRRPWRTANKRHRQWMRTYSPKSAVCHLSLQSPIKRKEGSDDETDDATYLEESISAGDLLASKPSGLRVHPSDLAAVDHLLTKLRDAGSPSRLLQLEGVPLRGRQTFLLHLHGLSPAVIAKDQHRAPGAAKQQIRRITRKLRGRYQK